MFAKSRPRVNTQRNCTAYNSEKGHKFHLGPQAEKKGKGKEKSKVVNTEIREEERLKKVFDLSCKDVCCSKGGAYSVLFNLKPC